MENVSPHNELSEAEIAHLEPTNADLSDIGLRHSSKPQSMLALGLKGLLAFVLIFAITFQAFLIFSPRTLGRVFFSMGFDNASGYFTSLAFERSTRGGQASGDINLLAFTLDRYAGANNHRRFAYFFANHMLSHESYSQFVVNRNALDDTNSAHNLLTSFNYDNFLKSVYVRALFREGQVNGAFTFAQRDLENLRNPIIGSLFVQHPLAFYSFKYNFVMGAFIREFLNSSGSRHNTARALLEDNLQGINESAVYQSEHMLNNFARLPTIAGMTDLQRLQARADIRNRGLEMAVSMHLLNTHFGQTAYIAVWQDIITEFNNLTIFSV
ncbi:MAG: hypothetical protein FWB72_02410 [Firmicutes bacterium]|nr:hypothetical protein [Bacillota bacterium]